MKANTNKELLLVILSARHPRMRMASVNMGRLVAVIAGIAAILLLAGRHPVQAGDPSAPVHEVAGIGTSILPGGTGEATRRPQPQAVARGGARVLHD